MDNKLSAKIDEIRNHADIVDIISRHINVTKKGKNYVAICPFHNDTNPSLSINKDKQIFKCFVCNEAGNVFSFIHKYKNIPYMNAVKEVADMVGIEFKLNDSKPTKVVNKKIQVLYDIIKDATLFYKNNLFTSQSALLYCQNRNLTNDIINNFNIGFSSDQYRVIKFLQAKGYLKEDIYRSGIALDNNGELIDRFANRLIFPISDLNGNIVAFSGRIIEKSDMAKYVNSPETEIFVKGNTLYNYYNALPSIKKNKKMYICEGYMDCIALNKIGFNNTIALMGTAFTKEHLKVLKFLGVEIVLVLDGDNPGNINASKLANELLLLQIDVKVIPSYKDVKDVDEFLKKYGDKALVEHLKTSEMNSFDFDFYLAKKTNLLDNYEDKKKFLNKMCERIAKMDIVDADNYIEKIHQELGFSTTLINSLVSNFKSSKKENVINEVKKYQKLTKYQTLQIRILSQMMDSKEAIEIFVENLVFLENESYRKIALMISDYYNEHKNDFNIDYLVADLYTKVSTEYGEDNDMKNTLFYIDQAKNDYPSYSKESFKDLIYEMSEISPLEAKLEKIQEELKYASDKAEINNYILEAIAIKQLIKEKKEKKKNKN